MKWKEIPNTDGLYLVSDEAKIFSVRNNRLLNPYLQSNGYWRIELNINGKCKKYFLHRLVAEAFIPNPKKYPCVNHKDENPSNNHVSNLEWCTHEYNCNYGTRVQRILENRKIPKGADHPQSIRVYQYTLDGKFVAEYGSYGEAGRATNLSDASISRAASGKRKQYAGFYWSQEKKFAYTKNASPRFRKGAILKCDKDGNVIKRYETSEQLSADGYRQICVNRVCRGERHEYKGYTWKHEGE